MMLGQTFRNSLVQLCIEMVPLLTRIVAMIAIDGTETLTRNLQPLQGRLLQEERLERQREKGQNCNDEYDIRDYRRTLAKLLAESMSSSQGM